MPSTPPIVMNWQERARRAEMIAERLVATGEAFLKLDLMQADRKPLEAFRAALDAWHQHQADLQTLAQAPAQQVGA